MPYFVPLGRRPGPQISSSLQGAISSASSTSHDLAGTACRCGWVMVQSRRDRSTVAGFQMQPDSDFLLMANQMASSDTQERRSKAPCCWVSRRLLAKERLCNQIGHQARLEKRLSLDDTKLPGSRARNMLCLITPKTLKMSEANHPVPGGTTEAFTITHITGLLGRSGVQEELATPRSSVDVKP